MTSDAVLSSDAAGCLSEEEVLAFAGGQLSSGLRERAHRHLDSCEDCQQLLNEAVHALATARTAGLVEQDEMAWSTTFRPGSVVGRRYEIRRFVARGGMGEVYEAFDRDLQERVALKTVTSTAGDNPSAVRRLKAEVQLARRVSHPNVCRIYDFGRHQVTATSAPISFLTMEFVEGETLGVRLRRDGALPVAEAVQLGRALLHGLAAAHAAGVLHRDFKSDNVLLRRDGDRLEPLILDFGLARALDHVAGQSSTSNQGLVGTFAYMAPDQLEGQPYTTASDIYSFGLVWFEMLTGELPFKARSSPAVTTLERLTKPVPLPSSKNPLISRELDTVVLACLRRSVRDRLQTAAAVLARLDELELRALDPKPKQKSVLALAVAGIALGAVALGLVHNTSQVPQALPSAATSEPRANERSRLLTEPRPATSTPVAEAAALPVMPTALQTATPGAPSVAGSKHSKLATEPARTARSITEAHAQPPIASALHGWENPFGVKSEQPSAQLGAVLNQPLDRRAPSGNTEFPEGSR